RPNTSGSGWQRFANNGGRSMPAPSNLNSGSGSQSSRFEHPAPGMNGGSQGGWQRFSSPPPSQRGGGGFRGGAPSGCPGGVRRPQLELRRPMVAPRSNGNGGYSGGGRKGGHTGPASGGGGRGGGS